MICVVGMYKRECRLVLHKKRQASRIKRNNVGVLQTETFVSDRGNLDVAGPKSI